MQVSEAPEEDPREAMRQLVRGVLDDFSRRVLQAHSFDEVEAHWDELAELIVSIVCRYEHPVPVGSTSATQLVSPQDQSAGTTSQGSSGRSRGCGDHLVEGPNSRSAHSGQNVITISSSLNCSSPW
jgi:hypothetical protein